MDAAEVQALAALNLRTDTTSPQVTAAAPSAVVPAGTSPVTLAVETNEAATCRFASSGGSDYTQMPSSFTAGRGGFRHSAELTALSNGASYSMYVRCRDAHGNINTADTVINFRVGATQPAPAAPPNGRAFFLAVNGVDTNPGTIDQPFRTFAKAGSVLQAGDILYVRAGIYDQMITDGSNSGESWDRPITYKAYPGERPVLRPAQLNNVVRFNLRAFIVVDGFILDGIKMLDYEYPVVKVTSSAHHIRIANCEIMNSLNGMGIQMSGPRGDYVEVLNNDIHDNGNIAIGTQNHGIYLSTSNCIIENNRIYRNSSWGIHGYGGTADNTIVRGNVFYGQESGVLVSNGSNWLVANNVFYNAGVGVGINIRDYTNISGTKIYNNTVVDSAIGIAITGSQPVISATEIVNNIVYKNSLGGISLDPASVSTSVRSNFAAASPSYSGSSLYDSGSSTTTSGNLIDGTSLPAFLSESQRNYRLTSSSIAIDRGETLSAVPLDIELKPRPKGSGYDLGAYEFDPAQSRVPLAPANLRVIN